MSFPVIDAHQHVWDPSRAEYDWLGEELAPINRVIGFEELEPELRAAGVDATVLVQSADNAEDTALMRACAEAHSQVAAIVGYAPLHDPEGTARTLAGWGEDPLMVGVRTLIHNQPDPHWLLRDDVAEGLRLLEAAGKTFDLVAVLPEHLLLVPVLSERYPALRIVIDHLAKPPVGAADDGSWARLMAEAAQNPRVFAKVSGLYAAGADPASWTTASVRPFVTRALEIFGAERLMYGGDWPISVTAGGYTRVWDGLAPIFAELDAGEREAILGRTAATFYGIDSRRLAI